LTGSCKGKSIAETGSQQEPRETQKKVTHCLVALEFSFAAVLAADNPGRVHDLRHLKIRNKRKRKEKKRKEKMLSKGIRQILVYLREVQGLG